MTRWLSVGVSRYRGDLFGQEQFMSLNAGNRVLDLIELVSREPGCRRMSVNEGRRTRPRQDLVWARHLAGTGPLAARPYTSRHDEVNHGNAADLGGPDGEALNGAERAAIVRLGPKVGVRFTGLSFSPPEPWHVEADETEYNRKHYPPATTDTEETTMNTPALIQRDGGQLAAIGLEGSGYVVIRNEAHYAELANVWNSTGTKLKTPKSGLVTFPEFRKLGSGVHFTKLSTIGYDEALMAYKH